MRGEEAWRSEERRGEAGSIKEAVGEKLMSRGEEQKGILVSKEHDSTATICQHSSVSNSAFICLPVHCGTLTFSFGVNTT